MLRYSHIKVGCLTGLRSNVQKVETELKCFTSVIAILLVVIGGGSARAATITDVHAQAFGSASQIDMLVSKGIATFIALDFEPTLVSVGDPSIADVSLTAGQKFPMTLLLGKKTGVTTLVIFDNTRTARLYARIVVQAPEGGDRPVTVFHGRKPASIEELRCAPGSCENVPSLRKAPDGAATPQPAN